MTQIEALAKLRGMLNEAGAGGFYSDAMLYSFMDNGQRDIITLAWGKQQMMRKVDPDFRSDILVPLEVTESSGVADQTYEINLPADFLFSVSVLIGIDNAPEVTAYQLSYARFKQLQGNQFTKATVQSPKYYISGNKLGFKPDYTVVGSVIHIYIKTPNAISSTQNFTLGEECRLAIVWFAYSYAMMQDNRFQEASESRLTAINLIKDL